MHPSFMLAVSGPVQVNVLVAMCDCSRFMQTSRGRTSAQLFADLNDLYFMTEDLVSAAGGTVIKFMGDAALIVFPEELADQGIMALRELKASADTMMKSRPLGSSLMVNAHFGEVTMGPMGREGRLDVIGETVHIAATLRSRGFALSQQAFRCLGQEHRQLFKRFTPPMLYIPAD
jgi:class 3 adenylate cyclase